MNEAVTVEKKKRLEGLALKVKSNFTSLCTYDIIYRIMKIENITCDRACKGYQMLRSLGLIDEKFVKGGIEVETKAFRTFFTPVMQDLISRFDLALDEGTFFLPPIREGGQKIDIRVASVEEVDAYLAEYKRVNRVSYGDDNGMNRKLRSAVDINLDELDEPKQQSRSHGHVQSQNIAANFGNKLRKQEKEETRRITIKMTDALLGLDTNF